MIDKKDLQKLINEAMTTGADFAEIFLEDSHSHNMRVTKGDVTSVGRNNVHGAGVRLILGTDEVYAYTNDVSYDSLLGLVNNLKASFNGPLTKVVPLGEAKPYNTVVKKRIKDVSNEERAEKLIQLSKLMSAYDEKIIQSMAVLSETEQDVLIVNSNGVYQDDLRVYTRVFLVSVAKDGENMQQGYESQGRYMGFEIFDEVDFESYAKEAAISSVKLLEAEDIVAQVMPVVLNNGFGGVIFHEACGHPLEATSVAKGLSPFVGKLGEKVGSDVVTAYDDGDVEGAWGRSTFDDEGMKTQKNLLIEDGVLKGYLIDYRNSRKMKMEPTGSARRQSYKYSPTSRMNSTYIAPGKDKPEDIIKDTKFGLYAKKLGGGTVDPASGEFNFAVAEGYMIEDGKLTTPVRGAMLIGHGKDVLFKIDRVADNLELGQGMCGSQSGSIPVDVGQPTLRVSEMTVGGSGGRK